MGINSVVHRDGIWARQVQRVYFMLRCVQSEFQLGRCTYRNGIRNLWLDLGRGCGGVIVVLGEHRRGEGSLGSIGGRGNKTPRTRRENRQKDELRAHRS